MRASVSAVLALLATSSIHPKAQSAEATEPTNETERGNTPALAWAAAAVPGVLAHGAGHYVAGRRRTAVRLATLEASGLGLVLTGGIPLVLTGASRYFVAPAAVTVIGGVGLFAISFFSDVYGLAAPEGGTGAPLKYAPLVESRLGYVYIYDPQFSYRHFATTSASARYDAIRVSPAVWISPGGGNERLRLEGAYRFAGPRPNERAPDGSFLDVDLAVTRHAFSKEEFTASTLELALGGRLDLRQVDRNLRGSFAEMAAGIAARRVVYDLARAQSEHDIETLLLARLAYGFYLGGPHDNAGEVKLYYDHRHDDFAAGLQMPGLGSGVAGHFGLSAEIYGSSLGLGAQLEAGSAYVVGLSAIYRYGRTTP